MLAFNETVRHALVDDTVSILHIGRVKDVIINLRTVMFPAAPRMSNKPITFQVLGFIRRDLLTFFSRPFIISSSSPV